jgi:hypothetical protein
LGRWPDDRCESPHTSSEFKEKTSSLIRNRRSKCHLGRCRQILCGRRLSHADRYLGNRIHMFRRCVANLDHYLSQRAGRTPLPIQNIHAFVCCIRLPTDACQKADRKWQKLEAGRDPRGNRPEMARGSTLGEGCCYVLYSHVCLAKIAYR